MAVAVAVAVAVFYNFPTFHSVSSHKLLFSLYNPSPNPTAIDRHKCIYSAIVACSIKKSAKASRKVRSDADLCNDIRDFLSSAGLPENYVPTMKELSDHGRRDLANVVRRRGYKFITHLLTASSTTKITQPDIDTGQNKKHGIVVDVPSNRSIQVEDSCGCTEIVEELKFNDEVNVALEPNSMCLQKKVAKFIQHGELDAIEVGGLEIINGSVRSSAEQIKNPKWEAEKFSKSIISSEEQRRIDGRQNLIEEKVENQDEVRRLKTDLNRKELELTQLKEQIEKEKLALSLLQSKSKSEVCKAQKLLSQKETEALAAEESLCGLMEVEIDYSGDGEIVELAGSFNGWDHKIIMDLQPSSSVTLPAGTRSPPSWQTILWLYPGVYEMKFIVDGHWRADPQRESIQWNGVHNNVLRVE